MLLKLVSNCGFEVLVIDQIDISLHQRANRLIHSLFAHLERVADFDAFDIGKRVLPSNRLIRVQSWRLVIVLGLLEALVAASRLVIRLVLMLVALQVDFGTLERHKLLLDQIWHVFLN